MRISDWSSDVCSSDLISGFELQRLLEQRRALRQIMLPGGHALCGAGRDQSLGLRLLDRQRIGPRVGLGGVGEALQHHVRRSEEHTSELQSLMRISYAVFCLKKKNTKSRKHNEKLIETHRT